MGYEYTEQDFGSFFYKGQEHRLKWSDAISRCENDGSLAHLGNRQDGSTVHLAVPKSEEENAFIANVIPGKDCCSYKKYHTQIVIHKIVCSFIPDCASEVFCYLTL